MLSQCPAYADLRTKLCFETTEGIGSQKKQYIYIQILCSASDNILSSLSIYFYFLKSNAERTTAWSTSAKTNQQVPDYVQSQVLRIIIRVWLNSMVNQSIHQSKCLFVYAIRLSQDHHRLHEIPTSQGYGDNCCCPAPQSDERCQNHGPGGETPMSFKIIPRKKG